MELFQGVDVDIDMHKEWCVILYFTILGVKVNSKIYDLLNKRFAARVKKLTKSSSSLYSALNNVNKDEKKSIFSIENKSRKNIEYIPKRLRTLKNIRFSNASYSSKQPTQKISQL